jgi:aryl-alcohol dehydrogenase-like predicted oxidoreductase
MEHRTLGPTGESISALGFGTWPLAGMMGSVDRSQAVSLIRRAIDSGVTFIDTAEAYGDTEEILGEALADGYRQRCFLATKVSHDYSPAGVRKAAEWSLLQMKTDVIDLYQLHNYDQSVPLAETLRAVQELQDSGSIRHVGVSNFSTSQLGEATETARVVANQINYNALNRSPERELLPAAFDANVAILVHSSLAKGLLSGTYSPGHTFESNDERSTFPGYSGEALKRYLTVVEDLKGVASDFGLSMPQASLAWLLARPEVTNVLVGPKSAEQLEEALAAFEKTSPEDRVELRNHMDQVLDRHDTEPLCPFPNQLV